MIMRSDIQGYQNFQVTVLYDRFSINYSLNLLREIRDIIIL